MDREQIDKIIEVLESFRKHVRLYIGKVDVDLTIAYLNGLQTGLALFGYNQRGSYKQKVLDEHGWRFIALHHASQMQERGMTPEAVIDEILVIEIEIWKLFAQDLANQQRLDGEAN